MSAISEIELCHLLTSLTLRDDSPRLRNTAPIHPILRSTIPAFQDLMTEFLPYLFDPQYKILLKSESSVKLYLEWESITFSSPNSIPPVLCQVNQESFVNICTIVYSIYEEVSTGIQNRTSYNTQIPIPMVCGYGETDPWGIKNIKARPYTLGGYVLTGKGMEKYAVNIEDERFAWGQMKKKALNANTPQFSFVIEKDMIHPSMKGQIPQICKLIRNIDESDLLLSCNNKNEEQRIPEVNIIILSAVLTQRTIDEVGESLKLLDYGGDKTEDIHCIIDLLTIRANEINTHDYLEKTLGNPGVVIENLMSQYSLLNSKCNKRKGFMLELEVRRMLTAQYAPSFYPDRDSIQRKRYLGAAKYFAKIFSDKIIEISNLANPSKSSERLKIIKEVEKILSSIISNINTDISTGTYDKKTGVWVHDSVSSTIQTISRLTSCPKKLQKDITKDLKIRYYHNSQAFLLCPYDVPEHGDNVGLVNSTTVLTKLSCLYPNQKLELAKAINEDVIAFTKEYNTEASKRSENISTFFIVMEDMFLGRTSLEGAYIIYRLLRKNKRHNKYIKNDFTVVIDPYLNEVRINSASGRLVQPILCVHDGVMPFLELDREELITFMDKKSNNLEAFMNKYPDVLEYVDSDALQVSSRKDGYICRSISEFMQKSKEERVKIDYCCLSNWGYFGWNINHRILSSYDEAIRSVFYCSLSKSGIHNKILVKNKFDTYHKSLNNISPLYTNIVMNRTFMDRTGYALPILGAVLPAMKGINQEDGSILNQESVDNGMLASIQVSKQIILVDKPARTTNTHKVIKHSDQSKIDPVSGLPILNSYLHKGDAIVRNYEQISNGNTGITHKDNSETLFEFSPNRVESYTVTSQGVSLLLVSHNTLQNGDKMSSTSSQKSTAVMVTDKHLLPCTPTGLYPQITMSPTGVLTRKTLSMIVSIPGFLVAILRRANNMKDDNRDRRDDKIQINMCPIEENYNWVEKVSELESEYTKAKANYDCWRGESPKNLALSSRRMINPITNEVMEDIFLAPFHYFRSRHLVNSKKNICSKGKLSQETGQTTSKRKSGGAPKFDEMSRNVLMCYGAAYSLSELLSDPEDRRTYVHICNNCSMFARYVKNENEEYYVCDICFNKYNYSEVSKIRLTYPARKFFDLPRGRGIQLKLHPQQRLETFYRV